VSALLIPFALYSPKTLNCMAFQSFDYKLHGEGFIQKQVVPTKCDISTFLLYTFPIITKKKTMLNTCFSDAPSGSAY
jgi:hypothetical protein